MVEEVDLDSLVRELQADLGPGAPVGYLRGKAQMRDALVKHRRISELEAEELVDTLELRGYLQFLGDPNHRSEAESHWALGRGHP
jgi:hypothetical protein